MSKTEPFSIRLSEEQCERILHVIQACGGAYNRSEIISKAIDTFCAILPACPSILEGYNKESDTSVTQ